MTLTDFLLARIAEDESAMYAWDSDAKARVATMWTGPEPGYTTVASDQRDGDWVADGREVEDARHVRVLFDPARVLAECEAKRRIVDMFRGAFVDEHGIPWGEGGYGEAYADALRHLAAAYADHPDYREDWPL